MSEVEAGNFDTDSEEMKKEREKLKALRTEYLSKIYVKQQARPCPKCKVPIQKNGGLVYCF